MTKTIVVAAHGDDDATRDAVVLGVRLARALRARIVLAGIWVSPLGPGDGIYERAVREEVERELASMREHVPADIPCTVDIHGATSVVRGLHRVVEDVHADLLVVGPTHHGRIGRLAHGSVALTAVHDAACAVAIAPRGYRDARGEELADVVVGFDDGPESRAALEAGVELAQGTGGVVRLVHAVDTPYQQPGPPWVAASRLVEWFTELRAHGEETLKDGVAAVGGRVPVEQQLADGVPSLEITRAAQGALLLVVGSRGYGAARRLVLGSTSTELIAHGTVPVLVVPRTVTRVAGDAEPAVMAGTS